LVDDRIYTAQRLERDQTLWEQFTTRFLEKLPWPGPGAVYRLRFP